MDLIGQQITLVWYTTDTDGNAQDTDISPTVEVTVNGQLVDSDTTTTDTGVYLTAYTPTGDGIHVAEFTGTIDAVPYVAVQRTTVHDGPAEAASLSFPYGLSSWESVI